MSRDAQGVWAGFHLAAAGTHLRAALGDSHPSVLALRQSWKLAVEAGLHCPAVAAWGAQTAAGELGAGERLPVGAVPAPPSVPATQPVLPLVVEE